ncbi:hypothetical protein ZWY2020_058222 [Hordeum vulgare]|nr:hypothetical protein ZWY2020_058222 [Hordeum vulgare]
MPKRKIRLQKIECRWDKVWKEYRFVTPKYAKKFALKTPRKRPPLEDYQDAHPSSLKTIDDYLEEKTKHLSKLQKQAEATVRTFNEEFATAGTAATSSAAETSGMAIPQVKFVPPKPKASKPQDKMLQKAAPASAPKPSAPPKASKPEHKQIVKQLPTVSSSRVPSATSSKTKSSPTPMKTKVTAGRGNRPSPGKIIKVHSASEGSDEYDDETLQAIIRNKQERVAQASGSAIPVAMDPKVLLDYINIWYEDPNTPTDDLKLPPGISHMVATFINEAKWKETQAKQAKAAKLKKEKFLRQNLLNLTPDALMSTQAELKTLTDKYTKLSDHQSLKNNSIKFSTDAVDDYNKKAAPPATTHQPKIEEPQTAPAKEIPQESRADDPASDDSVPAEETASAEETARTDMTPTPEEKVSSPKSSKVKKITPSASDVKKTRAAEKEAKKRKASYTDESTEAKHLKSLDENAPMDPVPLNVAPSYEMTPFKSEDKEHLTDEEMKNAASEEHTDEEIQIDGSPQTFIPREEPTQGSAEPADEFGSSTKQTPQAEENQGENPQPKENPNPEQYPQPRAQDEEIPPLEQNPQPEAQVDDIAEPEQDPQPEAQAEEIPHPGVHAEENAPAPNPENALVVINPETTMIVSPQGKKQNLQPMQRQPSPSGQRFKRNPSLRNAFLNVLHEAGLLPMCSDICDWNSDIVLQFYETVDISGDPTDINTWVLDWMTQHTHFKAPTNELLRELPVSIPSEQVVKMYDERELPNKLMEVLMKPLAKGQPP